ncbi:MAG: hypothetical protein RL328_1315, partial [Acidobacteriota bacterium]
PKQLLSNVLNWPWTEQAVPISYTSTSDVEC